MRLIEARDWTIIAATFAIAGFAAYLQSSHIKEAKPRTIIPTLERVYQLPLRPRSRETYGIDKDDIIRTLESALALEKIKNVALKTEIDRAKYMVEEVFLASRSSLLALEKNSQSVDVVKEWQTSQSASEMPLGAHETDIDTSARQPVAKPASRPSPSTDQKDDTDSLKRTVPTLEPKTTSQEIVRSATPPLISAEPDRKVRPATFTTHLEPVSPEVGRILANFQHQPTKQGFKVIVPGIDLFVRNSRSIGPNARSILKPIAEVASLDKNFKLKIVGHTDGVKSVIDSNRLSRQRAELVKQFLSEKLNVGASRITAHGKGKDQPIASNATLDGRQSNRRIEIDFSK